MDSLPSSKIKFWFNLASVIATTYVIIWYFYTPTNNQCQMTFMMEPPKFLPVPVEEYNIESGLKYPQVRVGGKVDDNENYTLYMYSEFGFPQSSNVHQDLRDSMPVLFVPGNAGSYQQVRSLASTCIRKQLQSLEAFKFAFYTIDFKGQLSGISGQLIEEQTLFVSKAIRQIEKLHPIETKGVILIGHSVGGFISKVLFTLPDFNQNSVPLVISLASPLTMPYLGFDSKISELYTKTNKYWTEKRHKSSNSIAISISGGRSDRLVPMHLSMDPQYDLSLVTSSMKDVWLETDHVCITWCRELMLKISKVMSELMDKKLMRIINNKSDALTIIKKEFLVEVTNSDEKPSVMYKNWKSMRSHILTDFKDSFTATRAQLSDNIIILNMKEAKERDLIIYIDHLEAHRGTGVYACQAFDHNETSGQIHCLEKIDLMYLSSPIPSRRFELKRTSLRLTKSVNSFNYIMFDFHDHHSPRSKENKIPESVILQKLEDSYEQELYIPTPIEYIFSRIFFINSFEYKIIPTSSSLISYKKYNLVNLKYESQVFSIKYKCRRCQSLDNQSRGSTILLSLGKYRSESFHPVPSDKSMSIEAKISSHNTILEFGDTDINNQKSQLELYVDGACEHVFRLELDIFNLIIIHINKNLGKILALGTYLAWSESIEKSVILLSNQQVNVTYLGDMTKFIKRLIVMIVIFVVSNLVSRDSKTQVKYIDDTVSSTLIVCSLAYGAIAFMDYFTRRLIDLATILNRLQSSIRQKINTEKVDNSKSRDLNGTRNGTSTGTIQKNYMNHDFNWLLIILAIGGSFIFSAALASLFVIFFIIKLELCVLETRSLLTTSNNCTGDIVCCNKTSFDQAKRNKYTDVHNLLISILVLSELALLSNIPLGLIRLNDNHSKLSSTNIFDIISKESHLPILFSLILIKLICKKIDSNCLNEQQTINEGKQLNLGSLSSSCAYLVMLLPTVLIDSDIYNINQAQLITFGWLNLYFGTKFNQTSHAHQQTGTKAGSEKKKVV